MSVTLPLRILELVCSRICHDLVSPVGAVNNGIELMEELGADAGDEALGLISSSVEQASIRLKFFRLAYGAAGSEQYIPFKDVKKTFEDWIKAKRITVDWVGEFDFSDAPMGFAKVFLNLLALSEECNPGDGNISVKYESPTNIRLTLTGKKPRFHEGMEDALLQKMPVENLSPRTVHAYATGLFTNHFGFKVEVEAPEEGKMIFTLSLKE